MEKEFNKPSGSPMSQGDKLFLQKMETGIYQQEDGHFMPLPFKTRPQGANTHAMSLRRLHLLERKFKKYSGFKTQYKEIINQLLDQEEAEEVPVPEINQTLACYIHLAYFGVYYPKKPDKIRVVFDAGAKSSDGSLNNFLLQGPEHVNKLLGVLL